jgi:hypothetical protein
MKTIYKAFDGEEFTNAKACQTYENQKLPSPIKMSNKGTWKVTTEGDCEGKSIRVIGKFEGTIPEIVKILAFNKINPMYSFQFSLIEKYSLKTPPKDYIPTEPVPISLNIGSGTWDMSSGKRVKSIEKWIDDPTIKVTDSNYFASVNIGFKKT